MGAVPIDPDTEPTVPAPDVPAPDVPDVPAPDVGADDVELRADVRRVGAAGRTHARA